MAQGKFNEDEKEEATAMRKMEIRCNLKLRNRVGYKSQLDF